ncbi:hypothetical protein XELAEV_18036780mg [Xenopus laevis]|uniref:Uncharacterized protein n=1 Tax=Xenopus laevis TaxID=8355 RepID=A0A974CC47_XENLA|nr:hypothetical protein XELAEV_18036780mg [Xenopus laevis]
MLLPSHILGTIALRANACWNNSHHREGFSESWRLKALLAKLKLIGPYVGPKLHIRTAKAPGVAWVAILDKDLLPRQPN